MRVMWVKLDEESKIIMFKLGKVRWSGIMAIRIPNVTWVKCKKR